MESAGKRRRSRTDDSLISAFNDLRDSSIIQTGPKRPRGGGRWNFTPDPSHSERPKRKSTLRKPSSESSSLLKRTIKKTSRKQPANKTSESTPHTDMVQTVKEFIDAGTEVSDLVSPKAATSRRYQLTPTPASRSPRRTRSIARNSMNPTTPVSKTSSSHTNSSDRILEDLSSVTKSPLSTSKERQANQSASVGNLTQSSQPSSSNAQSSQPSSSNVGGFSTTPITEALLEPLDNEENVDAMDEADDDMELVDESDHVVKGRVLTETSVEDESQTIVSSGHSKSTRMATKHKPASQTKRKPPKSLPRSLIKNLFTLYSKKRLTKDAMDLVLKFSELYLKQASHDISTFAAHAGRKTIEVNDVVLLLHRQRALTDKRPFEYLVNTHLPMEYSQELLSCAMAGKTVTPQT